MKKALAVTLGLLSLLAFSGASSAADRDHSRHRHGHQVRSYDQPHYFRYQRPNHHRWHHVHRKHHYWHSGNHYGRRHY